MSTWCVAKRRSGFRLLRPSVGKASALVGGLRRRRRRRRRRRERWWWWPSVTLRGRNEVDTCVGGFSVELPGVSPHRDLRIFFSLYKKANKSRGRLPRNQEPSATGVLTTTWTHMQSRRSDLFLTGPRIESSSCTVHAVRKRGQVHFSPSSSLSILFFRPVYAARVSQISFFDHLKGASTDEDQPSSSSCVISDARGKENQDRGGGDHTWARWGGKGGLPPS